MGKETDQSLTRLPKHRKQLRFEAPNTIFHAQAMDGRALCGRAAVLSWEIVNCSECLAELKKNRTHIRKDN